MIKAKFELKIYIFLISIDISETWDNRGRAKSRTELDERASERAETLYYKHNESQTQIRYRECQSTEIQFHPLVSLLPPTHKKNNIPPRDGGGGLSINIIETAAAVTLRRSLEFLYIFFLSFFLSFFFFSPPPLLPRIAKDSQVAMTHRHRHVIRTLGSW